MVATSSHLPKTGNASSGISKTAHESEQSDSRRQYISPSYTHSTSTATTIPPLCVNPYQLTPSLLQPPIRRIPLRRPTRTGRRLQHKTHQTNPPLRPTPTTSPKRRRSRPSCSSQTSSTRRETLNMRNHLHSLRQPHNRRHLQRLDQHNRNPNLHDNPLNAPLQRSRNPPPTSQQRPRPPSQQLRPSNPHSANAGPISAGNRPGTIGDKTARGAQVPRRGQPTQLEPRNILLDWRVRHRNNIHEPGYLRVGTQPRVTGQDP